MPARNEPVLLAEHLGLLVRTPSIHLAPLGHALLGLRPQRRVDILHYLLYSAWDTGTPARNSYLWSYRTTCSDLWSRQYVELRSATNALVESVISRAHTVFEDVESFQPSSVSFSAKSIRGVLRWLEALEPPVVTDGVFSRRSTCSPELLLMSIALMYRETGADIDVDLLLTPERRDMICRVCLLDPAYLDRLLDWVRPIYPEYLAEGTRTGAYGRFIRLAKLPQIYSVLADNN
ncbi:MAG: hypothetical protein ABI670_11265 [Chloroflexota bacterium]